MIARSQIRAFTPIEVLVVALLCLFLLLVVPPVAHVQSGGAFRMTCGTNLSGIGKAMMLYANDYEGELPRADGPSAQWGATPNWTGASRYQAYGMDVDGSGGTASLSSCLFLLVKYAEVTPRSFVCNRDKGATEFELSRVRGLPRTFELIDAWDFGPTPQKHVSYAYHMSLGAYPLKVSGDPGLAVAADRNPWIDSPFRKARRFADFQPGIKPYKGTTDDARAGNCFAHRGDGQNVLFLDAHVEFAKRAYCGLDDDNIYTISAEPDGGDPLGTPPVFPTAQPANAKDSLLLNDPP